MHTPLLSFLFLFQQSHYHLHLNALNISTSSGWSRNTAPPLIHFLNALILNIPLILPITKTHSALISFLLLYTPSFHPHIRDPETISYSLPGSQYTSYTSCFRQKYSHNKDFSSWVRDSAAPMLFSSLSAPLCFPSSEVVFFSTAVWSLFLSLS